MASERFSIAWMMAIVAIVALNLVFLRVLTPIWQLFLEVPPTFLTLVTVNIGLYRILARPRSRSRKYLGMMIGGALAVGLSLVYLVDQFHPPFGYPPGTIGKTVGALLPSSLGVLSSNRNLALIECAIVDALGIGVILIGGWLAGASGANPPVRQTDPDRRG